MTIFDAMRVAGTVRNVPMMKPISRVPMFQRRFCLLKGVVLVFFVVFAETFSESVEASDEVFDEDADEE